ncbi:UdgX family uracil-DNA binding protein [uncultured Roseobacter sp.]|uniref:UdgX family uracil-DNA binding protein n=1 Tax=uncultured Roseobacter sp. TaxID=114847 RepID=UPI00260B5FA3|nr:UdgX family uracil-DNA binding protein [uncultured Roseobacter sp.]
MPHVVLPRIGTDTAWRDAARCFLAASVPPDRITWGDTSGQKGLFDDPALPSAPTAVTVPRAFLSMANCVVWHSDPSRFARLYSFLWRLKQHPHLMSDRGDAELARLRHMEKNVRRCQHKMKAFVRFRDTGTDSSGRRSFAAWFEPTHHTVEPTAQFFVRRFADMDWQIVTPDISAFFQNGQLHFKQDLERPDLPEDASEALWVTYFRNIFNPARLKVQAMKSEMPQKYWKNLPEAAAISELVSAAPARAREMARNAPTLPPARVASIRAQQSANTSAWTGDGGELEDAIRACDRCALHKNATQAVVGVGPRQANLMIVGEQPGDAEDLSGLPFVGPAGKLFDEIAVQVGLDRNKAFVTNAVKHFKFLPRGRKRIHQRPDAGETEHCKWWLDAELRAVRPSLVLAMGSTAAFSLTGNKRGLKERRGTIESGPGCVSVLITYHPAYLLHLQDPATRAAATAAFRTDLQAAAAFASSEGVVDAKEIRSV